MKNKTNSRAKKIFCAAVLTATAFLTTVKINAADGDLDSTFDADGIVTTDFNSSQDLCNAAAIQADGKIVVAGTTTVSGLGNFALARYNQNGALDTTFDGDGKVNTLIGAGSSGFGMAIQTDGKIVVVGTGRPAGQSDFDFVLARYNQNGSLDTTFNSTGTLITRFSTGDDLAVAVAVQTDGKIVVAGYSIVSTTTGFAQFALARYNANGSLDTTFDADGKVTTSFAVSAEATDVFIQPDGKIVAAGLSNLARYNTNGALDTTFGTGGRVFINNIIITAAALQADGNIVVAGFGDASGGGAQSDFALARLTPGGVFESGFGSNGRVFTSFGNLQEGASAVVIQADGKIIAAGSTRPNQPNSIYVFALARYNANGSLDTSFSGDGKVTTDLPNNEFDEASDVALQADGKIVAAGTTSGITTAHDFAVVRYENSGAPIVQRPRQFDFDGDFKDDVSVFRSPIGTWFIQRSQAGFLGQQFGASEDLIAPADFDGDGKTDLAVFRPSNGAWYRLNSSNNSFSAVQFGQTGDSPRPGDFDGDGKADISVFRPSSGTWFRLNSSNDQFNAVQFGANGDVPVIGDFDGDLKTDIALFRPAGGFWFRLNSSSNQFVAVQFGQTGDIPAVGDFDGDGKADISVFRPSGGNWFRLNSASNQFNAIQFGQNGDIPTAADYDGDGKTDISVFRPAGGFWFWLNSSNGGFSATQFGTSGDKPLPSAFQ